MFFIKGVIWICGCLCEDFKKYSLDAIVVILGVVLLFELHVSRKTAVVALVILLAVIIFMGIVAGIKESRIKKIT